MALVAKCAVAAVLLWVSTASAGHVWPKPLNQSRSSYVFYIDDEVFEFKSTGFDSDILQAAFERYSAILFGDLDTDAEEEEGEGLAAEDASRHETFVDSLKVHVASNDQSLNLQTDESYVLDISAPSSFLSANTVYGALHGLETFSQLLDSIGGEDILDEEDESEEDRYRHKKHKKHHKKHHKKRHKEVAAYSVNQTYIWDVPRFRHRGLLLDTARHFLPVSVILDHLDAMAWSKLNVLHWHIVDDQSFPFVSRNLPHLSREGAFSADLIYTPKDVQQIVSYAKRRGIRVVPEFDTPGHTLSWGKGYPDLLADCYDEKGRDLGTKGPLNPARNETYELLWALLQEIAQVFPDTYIHLGGDEVPFECWLNNPEIKAWMAEQDPEIRSMPALEEYFERRVLDLSAAAGRSYIVWQEILDNNVKVRDDTVIHVWKWWWPVEEGGPLPPRMQAWTTPLRRAGKYFSSRLARFWHWENDMPGQQQEVRRLTENRRCTLTAGCLPQTLQAGDPPGWTLEMERVTSRGYRTLLSSPWYLNLGGFASGDWAQYYAVEPLGFDGSKEQKALVIGGEACMWGEYVDATNSIQRTWPRAAAVAERLWSEASVRDEADALQRLSEFRCRMLERGVAAEPLGPGYCLGEGS